MHRTFGNFIFNGLIFLFLASSSACNLANAKADDSNANQNTNVLLAIENKADNWNAAKQIKRVPAPTITSASVAGSYEYNTLKNSTGYINSLDIKDRGRGRLHVSLSGSYIYQANGAETFHEASGEGDAQLTGNTAIANIKDENDINCRVTIVFSNNRATVKIPAACHFNIALDGIYKKGKSTASLKAK